jgi:Penicillin binding protein transpeptidase domain
MVAIGKFAAGCMLAVLLFPAALERVAAQSNSAGPDVPRATSRFAQSAIKVLDREFTSSDLSFLLLDAKTGVLLNSRWDEGEKPIPLGSLVKPFTAIAYAESHELNYPEYLCRGEASGCWQVRPHGKLDIVSAIAVSCNSYFRELAANLSAEELRQVSDRYGIEPPDSSLSGPDLMGLGTRWQNSPLRIARAYLELYDRRDQPGVREIIAGMAESSRRGTGAGVGKALKYSGALVKTGTAVCTHAHSAPADGFVVALVPASQSEVLLMIRVHGVAGAKAAETAGRMLRRMEE